MADGPACLTFHSHPEEFTGQQNLVFVGRLQHDSAGADWEGGSTPGSSIPIDDFFIAKPSGDAQASNEAAATTADIVPLAPTNPAATPLSASRVQLNWTDASSNESGYLTHKVVRSLGMLAFDNQARV